MGRHVFKPLPQEDFYVEWSTVVDNPVDWGSAEELGLTDELLEIVDSSGTSSYFGLDDWRSQSMIFRDLDDDESYYVPRQDIRAYCDALGEDGIRTKESQKFVHLFIEEGPETELLPEKTAAKHWQDLVKAKSTD